MKVLVIGSGGREHALVWKIRQSKKVEKVFCAPGNGGISQIAKCVNVRADNIKGLVDFATRNKIGLTVVGPEQPLALGIVDEFQRRKLKIFGPEKKAAQLESSKVFAKEFMQQYHIPTAPFKIFDNQAEAIGFCKSVEFPVVVKVDGLAAGKGVMIVHNFQEAETAIEAVFDEQRFGTAGSRIVIESCLVGQEVSVMALTDGKSIIPLLPSQDHKQAFEGDSGPNTGGMGAFCPAGFITDELMEQVVEQIFQPTVAGLRNENIPYRGVIYAGIMLTKVGPKVLEYNCRFGDPETQVVLPLLKTDLLDVFKAVIDRRLSNFRALDWRPGAAACVIMASEGYPGHYESGRKIIGLQNVRNEGCYIFHSGTRRDGKQWLTDGGRVLGVMGSGDNLQAALKKSYSLVDRIKFPGAMYRRDIGFRVLGDKRK
ncbi:MAG: phosphoribosylamine--glycine ligase [candidate division Zixibacteria bacterium]|nr:phosphoribosylamine--glycine ligase [candidate division Zixibacteria bacterium]